jgi:hypothetical protein
MTEQKNCVLNGVVINKDMQPWTRLAPLRQRERLIRRLTLAVSQLRAGTHYESAAAVAEALEVIRAMPYGRMNENGMAAPDYTNRRVEFVVAVPVRK